jgi:hypothetical protein
MRWCTNLASCASRVPCRPATQAVLRRRCQLEATTPRTVLTVALAEAGSSVGEIWGAILTVA